MFSYKCYVMNPCFPGASPWARLLNPVGVLSLKPLSFYQDAGIYGSTGFVYIVRASYNDNALRVK